MILRAIYMSPNCFSDGKRLMRHKDAWFAGRFICIYAVCKQQNKTPRFALFVEVSGLWGKVLSIVAKRPRSRSP